jgi:hypothetical protein
VDFLESIGFGSRVYVGKFVLDEIQTAGLVRTPESEKKVRLCLRERHGSGFLATLAQPLVQSISIAGTNVLIDAVASLDEARHYQTHFGERFELIAISSSFERRLARLATRGSRSMNEVEIRERDEIEGAELRSDLLLASAKAAVENNSSMEAFCASLRAAIGC